ncbi:hypothetical protein QE390_004434 [Siphonobacter sp. SORGH_AS 1065]|nr:hypothetical protein [Siphonobacter sp. SORGH_AS_1065]
MNDSTIVNFKQSITYYINKLFIFYMDNSLALIT